MSGVAASREWLARLPMFRTRIGGGLVTLLGALAALIVVVVPLEPEDQAWLAIGGLVLFLVVNLFQGRTITLALSALSCVVSLRYIHWRISDTLDYSGFLQTFLGTGLLLAEIYAVTALLLSYFQSAWPLDRKPVPMPEDVALWPSIDVFIPSYNEALEVVKPTIFAALALDWPPDKLNVYVLDDGRRRRFPPLRREGRRRLHHPPGQQGRQGRQHQPRACQDRRRIRRGLRLRPRADAGLPAAHRGLAAARPRPLHGADPASFLLPGPVRAEPRQRLARAERGPAVLRPDPAGQRLLGRHLLLRLLRGHPAGGAGGDRRRPDRDGDRGLPRLAAHAAARLAHRLPSGAAGRRAGDRAADAAHRPAHALGPRDDPDPADRESDCSPAASGGPSGFATSWRCSTSCFRCRASSS